MSTPRLTIFNVLSFLLTLAGIAFLRYMPESISNPVFSGARGISAMVAMHYFLFYTATFFAFALLLYLTTKQNIGKIINAVLIASVFVIFPPIIDLIVSNGQGNVISYFFFSSNKLLETFFTGGLFAEGISLGSKLIGASLVVSVVIYAWKATNSFFKTVVAALGAYVIIFLCAALPIIFMYILPHAVGSPIIQIEEMLSSSWYAPQIFADIFSLGNHSVAMLWWLVTNMLLLILAFFSRRELLFSWSRNVRWLRSFYYFFLAIIGLKIAHVNHFIQSLGNVFNLSTVFVFLITSLMGVWIAIIVNDLNDTEIDKDSTQYRPLISNSITKEEYIALAVIFSVIMGSGLFLLGGVTAMSLLAGQVLYFFYSAEPFRLKRNFLLSSITTGLAGAFVVVGGFFLTKPLAGLAEFPFRIGLFFFLVLMLIGNIKDIKDYVSDKKHSIMTIPVVFGEKSGRNIIAWLYLLSIAGTPFILQQCALVIPAILYGGAVFWAVKKDPFSEKRVFPFIFAYFILIAIFI